MFSRKGLDSFREMRLEHQKAAKFLEVGSEALQIVVVMDASDI